MPISSIVGDVSALVNPEIELTTAREPELFNRWLNPLDWVTFEQSSGIILGGT